MLRRAKGSRPPRFEAADELAYLMTFSQSITQAMARKTQDLSEFVLSLMFLFSWGLCFRGFFFLAISLVPIFLFYTQN